ncbi:hypothetical protein KOW79_021106 [Hemibagrus wyckioides]|uniref:Uncharacterized protein n=1 Tax=Hemibagrus wyckioides TaxID=337641 RepID=A0A9D3SCM2_9TELE|nr:hypothetical protein KOW79_021106 [Hemibagrus wyckioides]
MKSHHIEYLSEVTVDYSVLLNTQCIMETLVRTRLNSLISLSYRVRRNRVAAEPRVFSPVSLHSCGLDLTAPGCHFHKSRTVQNKVLRLERENQPPAAQPRGNHVELTERSHDPT